MKSRIWFLLILVPALTLAQQTQRFLPGRISPPAANANREQSTVSGRKLTIPQPPPFVTVPSLSFDNSQSSSNFTQRSSSSARSAVVPTPHSTASTTSGLQSRVRPSVRPVGNVQLQRFRPTPRSRVLPIRPRIQPTTSQFRPPFSTQPPTVFRRVNLNNQGPPVVRNRQPPTTSVARPSAVQVKPAAIPSSAVKPQQFPQRRIPSPVAAQGNRPATMARQPPTTITNPPQRLPSSQSTVAANPVPLARPQTTRLLPPSTAPIRRPISANAPLVSNSINVPPSPNLRVAPKPRAPLGASPPGIQPPSNSVVEQLNNASDFMLVAQRLQLRRFARHRNRRHALFIEKQLT
ncbi:hypothetical protein M3Y96_00114000 [Aphelenchoides besseyi]|nr:hypothetical protein M3Y96_00114000 [Aphelenchoides besseyi]